MNFHNFETLIGSRKTPLAMRAEIDSFAHAPKRTEPYIEPTFTKIEFAVEKPTVVLVSAVGATGKSALAQVLSNRLKLPLLNLARHKPVGDNTLTGLLTTAFAVEQLTQVFQGISTGEFGVILDGIDEGRSKTTESAFQAFLDDIVRLCNGAVSPSVVILGRTQILEECWLYLTDKGVATGLLTIDPFDLSQARSYIDGFNPAGLTSSQAAQYSSARDLILTKLSNAFTVADAAPTGNFLSFIGYPPVLNAIVTLLGRERNYHSLKEQLASSSSSNVEIELLHRIGLYILQRERDEKVFPNIVESLLASLPAKTAVDKNLIFDIEEQCMRLVAHCNGESVLMSRIPEPVLDAQYEKRLATFLPEHPFVMGREFRNVVFEAVALSVLMVSHNAECWRLALQYIDSHRHNYYLVYLLELIAPEGRIPLSCIRALLGAALEFKATNASVELHVIGPEEEDIQPLSVVDIEVELAVGVSGERSKTYLFHSPISNAEPIHLGSKLSSAYISLGYEVIMGGARELELTSPVEISAARIGITASALILRTQASSSEKHIILDAGKVNSDVTSLTATGVEFAIAVDEMAGLQYPLVQYAHKRNKAPQDPALREKYLRLRKILTHFRSHSKGTMAKYREKVENPRVAGNPVGSAVLNRLLEDKVLTLEGPMYFLQPEQVDTFLGVAWPDLRGGGTSDKLLQYLRSISV